MIEIRYSAPDSLEISGSVTELQRVRQEILSLTKSSLPRVIICADAAIDPGPYQTALGKLVVTKEVGPTKIMVTDVTEVSASGSADCLEAFASFFDFKSDAERGAHQHFEHYAGNAWIDEDSVPLVIGVRKARWRGQPEII